MRGTLDIVIVNWNSGVLLRQCLGSIELLEVEAYLVQKVIVVDNGSTDNSLDDLPGCEGRLEVIRCGANYGFARACNLGAAVVTANYILFLNPDTELKAGVLTRSLEEAAREGEATPSVVGVKMYDLDGHVMKSCARFPSWSRLVAASVGLDRLFPSLFPPHLMLEWDHASTRYVDQVMGAFFLVNAKRFDEFGRFDERFFVYYEELDYCFRAAKAGFRALHLADVAIFHVGRGTSRQVSGIAVFYSARSKIIYARKHFSFAGFLAVAVATLTVEPVVRILAAAILGRRGEIKDTMVAFGYLWRWAVTRQPVAGVT